MISFLNKLLSGSSEVSSKRLIGLLSFVFVIIFSWRVTFSETDIANEGMVKYILTTLFAIITSTIIGSTLENVASIKRRKSQSAESQKEVTE